MSKCPTCGWEGLSDFHWCQRCGTLEDDTVRVPFLVERCKLQLEGKFLTQGSMSGENLIREAVGWPPKES